VNCSDAKPLLQIYLDNEMDALTASQVDAHLRECAACRVVADAYLRQDALLREAVASDLPDVRALRARILADLPLGTRRRTAVGLLSAAAAVLIVACGAVVAVYIAGSGGGPVTEPRQEANSPAAEPPSSVEPEDEAYAQATAEHTRMAGTHGPAPRDLGAMSKMVMNFTDDRPVDLELAGLRLVTGHPCHIGEVPYAHLVYKLPDGRRVSVYLCKSGGRLPKGRETLTSGEEQVELAQLDGRAVAFSDAHGIRRAVVVDAASTAEVLKILGTIR
jgi:anti-sigma factor RsiW